MFIDFCTILKKMHVSNLTLLSIKNPRELLGLDDLSCGTLRARSQEMRREIKHWHGLVLMSRNTQQIQAPRTWILPSLEFPQPAHDMYITLTGPSFHDPKMCFSDRHHTRTQPLINASLPWSPPRRACFHYTARQHLRMAVMTSKLLKVTKLEAIWDSRDSIQHPRSPWISNPMLCSPILVSSSFFVFITRF